MKMGMKSGGKSDGDMYHGARMARIKELKAKIHALMAKGHGDDPGAMEEVTEELEGEPAESMAEEMGESVHDEEMDPIKATMRDYFKPKPKARRPGTAALIVAEGPAMGGKGKKPSFGKGKMG